MDPHTGKNLGIAIMLVGALAAFGGVRLLNASVALGAVLIVVGLLVLWLGQVLRDASNEEIYDRDIYGDR